MTRRNSGAPVFRMQNPYDEAELWGSSISDADWDTLFKRLDFMRPQYVRCMINSPFRYYDANTGKYDKTRNIHSISRLLSYCTKNDITVVFGEYNPPTWEMKEDQRRDGSTCLLTI